MLFGWLTLIISGALLAAVLHTWTEERDKPWLVQRVLGGVLPGYEMRGQILENPDTGVWERG
jgi:hypothetical protein